VLKASGFWIGFLALHYAYNFLPILPIQLISGTNESFFQHQKIAFYTYLMVCGIEYLVRRRQIMDLSRFLHSRLFATLLVPWLVFVVWYIAPAYYGPWPTVFLEILYSNIAVIVVAVCVLVVERDMELMTYSRALRVLIVALFVVSISLFTIFTYRLPWTDVFADPTLVSGH
jgi:hydrogenase-4 membrane subunit HyfE